MDNIDDKVLQIGFNQKKEKKKRLKMPEKEGELENNTDKPNVTKKILNYLKSRGAPRSKS